MATDSQTYDKPKLRDRLKKKIQDGAKGGRPGQWSARKAQLLAQAYKKEGGGYAKKPGKKQKSLKRWTEERWTTRDGKKSLGRGRAKRYLPAKAWEDLSPKERAEADASKSQGDARGEQFVKNPRAAKAARRKATKKKDTAKKTSKKKTTKKKVSKKKVSKKKVGKKKTTKKKGAKRRLGRNKAAKRKSGGGGSRSSGRPGRVGGRRKKNEGR